MIKKTLFIVFILFAQNSFSFIPELEYAREIKFSKFVSLGEPVKGPAGTWINLFKFTVGGLIKKQREYCFFYKSPLAGKLGEFSLIESRGKVCEWSPSIKPLLVEDKVEFIILFRDKKLFKIKYFRDNRTKEMTTNLLNINPNSGVFMIPPGNTIMKREKKKVIPPCGGRNLHACVRRFSPKGRDRCLDMDYYFFCSPGTTFSCKDQKVFCL